MILAKWMGVSWQDEQAMPLDVLEVVADLIRDEQAAAEKAARKR